MKFKKQKKPKRLNMKDGSMSYSVYAADDSTARLQIAYMNIGPRQAIALSKWLVRYAKWSSLE